jgi:hypothetical protein
VISWGLIKLVLTAILLKNPLGISSYQNKC